MRSAQVLDVPTPADSCCLEIPSETFASRAVRATRASGDDKMFFRGPRSRRPVEMAPETRHSAIAPAFAA